MTTYTHINMNLTDKHKEMFKKLDEVVLNITNGNGISIPIYRNEYLRYQFNKKLMENSNKNSSNSSECIGN